MENNEDMVLSGQKVGKEYQIPELVDLNGISEAVGKSCSNGSSAGDWCGSGGYF